MQKPPEQFDARYRFFNFAPSAVNARYVTKTTIPRAQNYTARESRFNRREDIVSVQQKCFPGQVHEIDTRSLAAITGFVRAGAPRHRISLTLIELIAVAD